MRAMTPERWVFSSSKIKSKSILDSKIFSLEGPWCACRLRRWRFEGWLARNGQSRIESGARSFVLWFNHRIRHCRFSKILILFFLESSHWSRTVLKDDRCKFQCKSGKLFGRVEVNRKSSYSRIMACLGKAEQREKRWRDFYSIT